MTKEKTSSGALDQRVYHTICWKDGGLKYWGQTYEQIFGSDSTKMAWMKYSDAETDHMINGDNTGRNTRLLRYADILLMHAEAMVKSLQSGGGSGTLSDAKESINEVRNRNDLGDLPSSMSETDVLREIEHQRICELADEGKRFYDLVRWNGSIDGSMTIKENLVQMRRLVLLILNRIKNIFQYH
jgi:hypothetical protein